jgi:hypothetical protein
MLRKATLPHRVTSTTVLHEKSHLGRLSLLSTCVLLLVVIFSSLFLSGKSNIHDIFSTDLEMTGRDNDMSKQH